MSDYHTKCIHSNIVKDLCTRLGAGINIKISIYIINRVPRTGIRVEILIFIAVPNTSYIMYRL